MGTKISNYAYQQNTETRKGKAVSKKLKEKSKKTYDLINNLQMITNRNLEISTQNDIFKSL